MKIALAACVLAAAAIVWPVGSMSAERTDHQRFRRQVAQELERRHAEIERLRAAVARGVPYPLRALMRITACEAGGNPRAVSPGGRYRGQFQFDARTWRSVGGRGDPAGASVAQQWARALLLLDARGTQPWPYCKRFA